MENINYFLKEEESNNSNNSNNINNSNNSNNIILSSDEVEHFINADNYTIHISPSMAEVELYYKTNFTVKQITQILTYYGIQKSVNNGNGKGKMTKDEMIQLLLFFESDPVNKECVQNRIRLWKNIQELKADSYFSKFILF